MAGNLTWSRDSTPQASNPKKIKNRTNRRSFPPRLSGWQACPVLEHHWTGKHTVFGSETESNQLCSLLQHKSGQIRTMSQLPSPCPYASRWHTRMWLAHHRIAIPGRAKSKGMLSWLLKESENVWKVKWSWHNGLSIASSESTAVPALQGASKFFTLAIRPVQPLTSAMQKSWNTARRKVDTSTSYDSSGYLHGSKDNYDN